MHHAVNFLPTGPKPRVMGSPDHAKLTPGEGVSHLAVVADQVGNSVIGIHLAQAPVHPQLHL